MMEDKKGIKKNKLLMHKKRIGIYNEDIKKIVLLFDKKSYNKILIGYDTYYDSVLPLNIRLPSKNVHRKYYKNNKK